VILKAAQAVALLAALAGFWLLTSTAWTALVGGVTVAVLLELHDARKGGD
jgi:hypothetical protein